MTKKGLIFNKFDDLWVLASKGRTPDGLTVSIEPVHVVRHQDAEGLKRVIVEALSVTPLPVAEPDYESDEFKRTVMAKALNLKTYGAFYKGARCFYIESSPAELCIQEWRKAPRSSFTGPALWKQCFGPDEMDDLVSFLLKQASVPFPSSPHESSSRRESSAARRMPRRNR